MSGCRFHSADLPQNLRSRISAVLKGAIVTRCAITAEGNVTHCKSLQGLSGLGDGVIRTLTTWSYEPAMLDGKPVPVLNEFDIGFTNEPGVAAPRSGSSPARTVPARAPASSARASRCAVGGNDLPAAPTREAGTRRGVT
ncbi:energy transducer TonB [Myxococcus sp. AM011]|uniref:energy transducer TonB n=1 Tax=Myxococcus sp. AM011 TaxID=2745200 RepID=UPI0034CD43C5